MRKPTYAEWQAIDDALTQAIELRESGAGGGHALLIQLLNKLGYTPMSSQEAEEMAAEVIAGEFACPR